MKYEPKKCEHCTQTLDYALALDRGTALIVLAVHYAIRRLGRNSVHLVKDMLESEYQSINQLVSEGKMTMRMIGNATRARYHGLIAFGDEPGTYVLTHKGREFVHMAPVKHTAIIDKVRGCNAGYLDDEVTIVDLLKGDVFWHGQLTMEQMADSRTADIIPLFA